MINDMDYFTNLIEIKKLGRSIPWYGLLRRLAYNYCLKKIEKNTKTALFVHPEEYFYLFKLIDIYELDPKADDGESLVKDLLISDAPYYNIAKSTIHINNTKYIDLKVSYNYLLNYCSIKTSTYIIDNDNIVRIDHETLTERLIENKDTMLCKIFNELIHKTTLCYLKEGKK